MNIVLAASDFSTPVNVVAAIADGECGIVAKAIATRWDCQPGVRALTKSVSRW